MEYAVVITARNEEKYLEKTLSAISKQTVRPSQIIVVDDGSTDRTSEIAEKYANVVIRMADRGYWTLGVERVKVLNEGLKRVMKSVDYVLTCGADDVLSTNYVESIVERMKINPRLVVASGRNRKGAFFEGHPRGVRVVDADFWKKINGLQYPEVPGYESWLYLKAKELGYEAISFRNIFFEPQRPKGSMFRSSRKARLRGEAMYALGYDWKYALGRIFVTFLKSPRTALNMLLGWFLHIGVKRLDVADWVGQMQRNLFWRRIQTIAKRRGRK
jgi:glycosyltransferase involved in cell wall biosynthesis